jgi:8-oxo-dGTP pyrophosphatase MutT (NUDIX family)
MTKRDKCAGGIIILPSFTNVTNCELYKILIVKQKYNNYWGLPKGHIEENESIYDTALREIYEEANLDITLLTKGIDYEEPIISHSKFSNNLVIIKKIYFFTFFLLRDIPLFKKIKNREISEIKWITFSQLKNNSFNFKLNRTLCTESVTIIEQLCNSIKGVLLNAP